MNIRKIILAASVMTGRNGSRFSGYSTNSGHKETVQGRIAGFGSIFINSVKYETFYADSMGFNGDEEGVITQVKPERNGVGTNVVLDYTVTVDENTIIEFIGV